MKIGMLLALVALSGCVAPQYQTYTPDQTATYQRSVESVNVASSKVEGVKRKQREAALKRDLAKTQEELEAAKKEIEELTEELRKAEEELKAAEDKKDINKTTYSSGAGVVHTGSRGGQYTISSSGKKVYKKRR